MATPYSVENIYQHTARIDAERVGDKLDNYDQVASAARKADEVDHEMTTWQALKRNKRAVAWSMFLSLALIMEGYDLVIINSFYGQAQFRKHYGRLGPDGKYYIPASWQTGLSNISLCGQIIGLLLNGYLSQKIGYRRTMMGALAFMACAIFAVFFAPNIHILLLGEFLCGLPWGIFQTLTTAYAADIMPIALRPFLTSWINGCWGLGILLSSGVARATLNIEGSLAYRLPFALQWLWPFPLFFGTYLAPESPWWLIRKGRKQDAAHSIRRLSSSFVTQQEIDQQVALMEHTDAIERAETEGATIWDCFKTTNLRRTEIGCVVFAIQYLSGDSLVGFAVTFFQQAGMSDESAFDFNLGVTPMYIVGTIISWFYLNSVGRRKIYIWGLWLMSAICGIIGVLGFFKSTRTIVAVGVFTVFLNLAYNISIGPVCYSIVAEISSSRLRPVAIVLSRIAYNLAGLVVNTITPRMIQPTAWGWGARSGLFWMVAAALCAIYCHIRLPETKDRSYGELDILFEQRIPARKFAKTKIELYTHAAASPKGERDDGKGNQSLSNVDDVIEKIDLKE